MNACSSSSERRSVMFSLVFCLALVVSVHTVGLKVCGATSASAGNLIFILDASGSMAAQVQGKVKMDTAKEVLSGLIGDLPSGGNVGLVVYGHREKGDCNDVEELSPLAPLDKDALIKKIKAINPKGKTPITISVRKVAEGLKTSEEEATIVLVSDGEETCEGDPCALVKGLKASGVRFVMHVIGFDVGEKEKTQLACIAEAGGGSYFTAKNAGELSVAAKKVVEKTEQSAGKLKLAALRNGKPFRAYCEIHNALGDEDKEKTKVTEGWIDVQGTTFKLIPGIYDVKVLNEEDSSRPTVTYSGVTIEAGKSIEKVADFSGGALKVKALRNGKPFRAYCEVFKGDTEEEEEKLKVTEGWVEIEGTAFKLTPGVYDVKVRNEEDSGSPTVSFSGVTIEAGKSIEKVAEFAGGILKVKALRNGKPFRAYCEVLKGDTEEEEEKVKVTEGWVELEGTAFKLTPGVYDVKVRNEEDAGSPTASFSGITIEAGKGIEKVAEFAGGTLKVKALRNGKPFRAYCEVYKAEAEENKEKEKVTEGWIEAEGTAFKLTSGVYDLIVENSETDEKKDFKGVTIEAGKTQTLEAQL